LLKTYPSLTRHHIDRELPMDEGWCLYAWALENDGWLQFAGIKRSSKGYIAQETERILNAEQNPS
jgi:hypothetical protein